MNPPPVAAVTSTAMVQDPEGIVLAEAKVTVDPPLAAVTAPPHVVVALGTAATSMPLGKVSVNVAVRPMAAALELLTVMVSLETPPAAIFTGLNALVTVGGAAPGPTAARGAVAGAALFPPLVCRVPAAIVLV
jgi:hypothetical protein